MSHDSSRDSVDGLPLSPSLSPTLDREHIDRSPAIMDKRDAQIAGYAMILGAAAMGVAEVLVRSIAIITNLAFYGELSMTYHGPAGHHLGALVIAVPVVGAIIVGLMARYGSRAIRGHGIPEAMEQILTNESRIPLKMTFLKPVSSAIAIGTGGPFGAEGPIIATGGALGSAIGQFVRVSAAERKTLLAAGAAAGMTAIFGTPIAAVLIAIELLLFEYKARSIVPVALACAVAGGLRAIVHGDAPCFAMPDIGSPLPITSIVAALIGIGIGILSCYVTRLVYWIEDKFEELPVHWMWWPAIGAVAVGLVGIWQPRTLGVGYDNIEGALAGSFGLQTLAVLCLAKFISWSIALGSGTSGGTLAPLMTLGSGGGYLIAALVAKIAPNAGIDPRVAALVGMTAIFAGASRALLASIAFALESTHQINAAIPVVAGVTIAYFMSCLLMKTTIMTEKLARRGVHVAGEYDVDPLAQVTVAQLATRRPRMLDAAATITAAIATLDKARHQAYPVVREDKLIGVVTLEELVGADPTTTVEDLVSREPVTAVGDETARIAVTRMAREDVGRLVVVDRKEPSRVIGILTRSDLVAAFAPRKAT